MWKKVSSSRMTSGLMDILSSNTGWGGTSNVYDINVGWIMIRELFTSSSFRMCLRKKCYESESKNETIKINK